MNEKLSCITINCGCCGNSNSATAPTPETGDGTPIGTVIAYMGIKAPQHYLACDGAVLKIADFSALSQQIQEEFGTIDYFGGDGITTFAVPDLRNEFLRGYHGEAAEQLSDEVGKHQEATKHLAFQLYEKETYNRTIQMSHDPNKRGLPENMDVLTCGDDVVDIYPDITRVGMSKTVYESYTSRPTNMAVLYCIKYE